MRYNYTKNADVIITGDVHGTIDIRKLVYLDKIVKQTGREIIVIVVGDFGGIWNLTRDKQEDLMFRTYYNKFSFTTLFVDGNHENFDRLFSDEFEEVDMFNGKVKRIWKDKVFMLQRGHIYTIKGNKYFTFGGGQSIDKYRRKEFISWWSQEIPNKAEMDLGLKNLADNNNEVDYILTHTCSNVMFNELRNRVRELGYDFLDVKENAERNLRDYFDIIQNTVKHKHWYFGHFHMSSEYEINDKWTTLYNDFKEIE